MPPVTTTIASRLLRDEGTGASQDFIVGVGFTAGTTTQLTLDFTPITAATLLVFFDGVSQSFNTWSLSGSTLTFMAPIPVGVQVVDVRGVVTSISGSMASQNANAVDITAGSINNVLMPQAVSDGQKAILLLSTAVGSNIISVAPLPAWTTLTPYSIGQVVTNNNRSYYCAIAGTSGSLGPIYDTGTGNYQIDGTVSWLYIGPASTSANIFQPSDVGKVLGVSRQDIGNGWNPWWLDATYYAGHVFITEYISPTSVQVSQATCGPPTSGTTQSWPYVNTPSVIVWGTDNSPAFQTVLTQLHNEGGGVLQSGPGNFCFAERMTVYSNTTVAGSGESTVFLPCGVHDTAPQANLVPLFLNYQGTLTQSTGHPIDIAAKLVAEIGDHNIHYCDFSLDLSITGSGFGDNTCYSYLVKNTTTNRITYFSTPLNPTVANNFTSCFGFKANNNRIFNTQAAFEPWGGECGGEFKNNYVVVAPNLSYAQGGNGQYGAVQLNMVGTSPSEDEVGSIYEIENNLIFLHGCGSSNQQTFGLMVFPDGAGSIGKNINIRNNTVICSGSYNAPVLLSGWIKNASIFENTIIGCDGTGGPPISVGSQFGNSTVNETITAVTVNGSIVTVSWQTPLTQAVAIGSNVVVTGNGSFDTTGTPVTASTTTSVSYSCPGVSGTTVGGSLTIYPIPLTFTTAANSNSVNVNWPSHGFPASNLAVSPAFMYIVGGPSVGGVGFNGYYLIASVPDGNHLTIMVSTPATTAAQGAWTTSGFAQIECGPMDIEIAHNRLIDCISLGAGLIQVNQTINARVVFNDASFTAGTTTGNYLALVQFSNINGQRPGCAIMNTGPTGSGPVAAGNNRICWNTYEPAPVVIDVDDINGIVNIGGTLEVNGTVVGSGGGGGSNSSVAFNRSDIGVAGTVGATLTLEQASSGFIYVYGTTTGSNTITIPVATSPVAEWLVVNQTSGGYPITVAGSGGGTVTISSGQSTSVWTDGSGIYLSNTLAGTGSLSYQNANSVAITGGSVVANTTNGVFNPLPVSDAQKAILLVSVSVGSNVMTVAMPAAWTATTAYTLGQVVTHNSRAYSCAKSGTSGPSGPSGDAETGAAQTDGSTSWLYIGPAPTTANIFHSGDVGKIIGVSRQDLVNGCNPWWLDATYYCGHVTITGYNSPTSVQVSGTGCNAPTIGPAQSWPYNNTPSVVMWGTDNSPAINAALSSIHAAGGGALELPPGQFALGERLVTYSNTEISGHGAATILMPIGVHDTSPQSNIVPVFANYAYTQQTLLGYGPDTARGLVNQYGDHNIHYRDFTIDVSITGTAFGGPTIRSFLAENVTIENITIFGTPLNPYEGPNFTSCFGFKSNHNRLINTNAAFCPWGGEIGGEFKNNYVVLPPIIGNSTFQHGNNQYNAVQINIVGTSPSENEIGSGFLIENNVIYLHGAVTTGQQVVGLMVFPDGNQSIAKNVNFMFNRIICTGNYNAPVLISGWVKDITVFGNTITGADGLGNAPIAVGGQPGNQPLTETISAVSVTGGVATVSWTTPLSEAPAIGAIVVVTGNGSYNTSGNTTPITASTTTSVSYSCPGASGTTAGGSVAINTIPASITLTNQSTSASINWPSHGFSGINLAVSPAFVYIVGGPTFAGINFGNYFPLTAVPDGDHLTIALPTAATSTMTGTWTPSSYIVITLGGFNIEVSHNKLIDCASPGNGLIQLSNVVNARAIANDSALTSDITIGNYLALVQFSNINGQRAGCALLNTGPAGTGSVQAGNNRICWNTYEPEPMVIDIDDINGVVNIGGTLEVNGTAVGSGGSNTPSVAFNRFDIGVAGTAGATLTVAQAASGFLYVYGTTTGSNTITLPVASSPVAEWLIVNQTTGGYPIVIAGTGGGTVTIPAGQNCNVWSDGSGIYHSQSDITALTAIATGSTTSRSMANRFGQVANPLDFGAAGNGTTDDTVAIQAAVNSGKPVFFPPGTYLVSSAIVIPQAGVTMFAQPFTATIKAANPFPGYIANGTVACFVSYAYSVTTLSTPGTISSDVYVDGLSFDLTAWNNTGIATDGLALVGVNNFSIINCFCNGGMSLAQIVGCSNGYEGNNRVINSYGNACFDHWGGSQNISIIGNYLHSVGVGVAINVNANDGTGAVAHTTSGFIIEGNQLFGSIDLDTLENDAPNTSQFVQKIIIQGNTIISPYGIYGRGQITDVKIIGNTIDATPISGNSPSPGIWIGLGSDTGGGTIGTPDSVIVTGNTIKGFVGSTVNAIQMEGTNSVVSDNITGGAYKLALQIGSGTYHGNIFPNGAYGSTVIIAQGVVSNVTAPIVQTAVDALTATGTNLATAFVLTSIYSAFNTVAAGTGCVLPANAASQGQMWVVWNEGSNALLVYALGTDTINYSASYSLAAQSVARFVSMGDGLWRPM